MKALSCDYCLQEYQNNGSIFGFVTILLSGFSALMKKAKIIGEGGGLN